MMRTWLALLTAGLGIGTLMLSAQSAPESLPQFEVASIKPNKSGDFRRSIGPAPGGFSALNVTLRELIPMAYGIPQAFGEISIVGGPKWMDDERFDIDAKTNGKEPAARIGEMLRALLTDRFQLKAHRETRELPVYALMMAEADRKSGPRLAPASYDCAARRAALARGTTPPPLPPPGPDGRNTCSGQSRPGNIWSKGFDIDSLTTSLTPFVGRVVRNETGLTGGFDYDLEWTPESPLPQRPDRPEPPIDPNGPSIFTALREQLGLKLESQRGPVDVVVIDSAAYPTPN